jgi:hypothetical protein
MVPRVTDLKIHQFWKEKLTKLPFLSFPISHVPPMKKKMKTKGTKNKVFKPQGTKTYLTLNYALIT